MSVELTTVRFLDGGLVQMDRSDYDRLASTQPPAVGVDVSDEMVSAGTVLSNIVYNLAQDDRLPEALRTSLDAARKRWDAALRTGGGA